MIVRAVVATDLEAWRPLWDGYNEFYERTGVNELPEEVTATTWARFLDPDEPMFALVAEDAGQIVGIVHWRPFSTRRATAARWS